MIRNPKSEVLMHKICDHFLLQERIRLLFRHGHCEQR